MRSIAEIGPRLGVAPTCAAMGLPRATYYRHLRPSPKQTSRCTPARALSMYERQEVMTVLHDPQFIDEAPGQVYATLLDQGRYLCSERTMYRILAENAEVRERRNQLRHPVYHKPELLATAANQVWSWDITKLLGPVKWTYYYLYVILDIFSRYVVGWLLARVESSTLAKQLIEETCERQRISHDHLTIHSDRGPSMTSKTVALMLADLGVTKSLSRPHVSNDNPYSEAQFKTLKYRPGFPHRFGSEQDARAHCRAFFGWYNNDHRHSGIGMMTPESVHYGHAAHILTSRQKTLNTAYALHPERFVKRPPAPPQLPTTAWINPPTEKLASQNASGSLFAIAEDLQYTHPATDLTFITERLSRKVVQ